MISYQKNRQLVFEISTITSKLFFCFYSGVWSKQKTPAGESPLSIEAKCMNQSKRYICLQATPLKLEVRLAPSKPDDHVYARMRKHWSEKRKASSRWLLCTKAVLSSGGRTERPPQGLSHVSSFYCTKLTYHLNFYISSRVNKTQTPFQSERISIFEMS